MKREKNKEPNALLLSFLFQTLFLSSEKKKEKKKTSMPSAWALSEPTGRKWTSKTTYRPMGFPFWSWAIWLAHAANSNGQRRRRACDIDLNYLTEYRFEKSLIHLPQNKTILILRGKMYTLGNRTANSLILNFLLQMAKFGERNELSLKEKKVTVV